MSPVTRREFVAGLIVSGSAGAAPAVRENVARNLTDQPSPTQGIDDRGPSR